MSREHEETEAGRALTFALKRAVELAPHVPPAGESTYVALLAELQRAREALEEAEHV